MKILYDHQVFAFQKFGGISRYFNELMKMASSEVEVDRIDPSSATIVPPTPEVVKHDLFSRGSRYIKRKLAVNKQETLITPVRKKYDSFPGVDTDLLSVVAKNKIELGAYDLIHPTYYDPYFLQLTDKPYVLTVYDMIHEIYKENFPLYESTSHKKMILCQKASKIIAISDKTKDDLMHIFNVPEDKICVTHLASDFNRILPKKPVIADSVTRFILFVGNRGGYKNFYFAVIALANLLKSDPGLVVLCTGHSFSDEEIALFEDFAIDKQIVHIYLEDDSGLAWAYQNAELFIFPSLYEGFGLPMLEAFASNCPVVSSTGGSLPEVGGEAALYFDPKSVIEIQTAVSKALYDSKVKADLIAKGRKRFTEFSWDRCREETMLVYKSVVH